MSQSCPSDPSPSRSLALEDTVDSPEGESKIPEFLPSLLQRQIQTVSNREIAFLSISGHRTSTKEVLALYRLNIKPITQAVGLCT